MQILVKSDDIRSGRKANVRYRRLRAAQESMGLKRKTIWACPGVEPGTSHTLSENHATRPTGQTYEDC